MTKCLLGQAVNTPEKYLDSFTKELDTADSPIDGWESNLLAVRKLLNQKGKCVITLINAFANRFFKCEVSPFARLESALNAYYDLRQPIKDLLIIINDADLVSSTSRYMLLGKALEIVDSLYPLTQKQDQRIETNFPDIAKDFNGVTIKKLMELSNRRKETRHYVGIKKNTTPHPEMTNEEKKYYYELVTLLCINVVRKELGLDILTFHNTEER